MDALEAFARRLALTVLLASFVVGVHLIFLGGRPEEFLQLDYRKQLEFLFVLPAMLIFRLVKTEPGTISFGFTWLVVACCAGAVLLAELMIPPLRKLSVSEIVVKALFWLSVPCLVLTIISAFRSETEFVFWFGAALTFAGFKEQTAPFHPALRVFGWLIFIFTVWGLYWVVLEWFMSLRSTSVPPRELFLLLVGFVSFSRIVMRRTGQGTSG